MPPRSSSRVSGSSKLSVMKMRSSGNCISESNTSISQKTDLVFKHFLPERLKFPLDKFTPCAIIQKLSDSTIEFGGIAQLGERLNGIQKVSGSIPLISTKTTNRKVKNLAVLSYPEVLMHPTQSNKYTISTHLPWLEDGCFFALFLR